MITKLEVSYVVTGGSYAHSNYIHGYYALADAWKSYKTHKNFLIADWGIIYKVITKKSLFFKDQIVEKRKIVAWDKEDL